MSKDLFGVDVQLQRMRGDSDLRRTVGELYFDVKKLRLKLQSESNAAGDKRLEGYEKIRTVGKGTFNRYNNVSNKIIIFYY